MLCVCLCLYAFGGVVDVRVYACTCACVPVWTCECLRVHEYCSFLPRLLYSAWMCLHAGFLFFFFSLADKGRGYAFYYERDTIWVIYTLHTY